MMPASQDRCPARRRAVARRVVQAIVAVAFIASPTYGELLREPRALVGVDRVVLATAGDLEITQGSDESLIVEAEPRVLQRITTRVDGTTLTIDTNGRGFVTREPVRFVLRVKRLEAIESVASGSVHVGTLNTDQMRISLNGATDIRIDALTARTLTVDASGAGSIAIDAGRVEHASLHIKGSVEYAAPRMHAREATIDVDGSADVTTAVDKSLSVTVRGAARVAYSGNPKLVERIEGAGVVEQRD